MQKKLFNYCLWELVPLVVTVILWGKFIYFSAVLSETAWTPELYAGEWVRVHFYDFSATLAVLLILFAPLLFLSPIWRFRASIFLNFILTSLIWANLIHLHFYGQVTSILSYLNATMLPWVFSSVLELIQPRHLFLYSDIVIAIIFLPAYSRVRYRLSSIDNKVVRQLGLALLITALGLALPTLALIGQNFQDLLPSRRMPNEIASTIGLLPYHVSETAIYPFATENEVSSEDLEQVQAFLEQKHNQQQITSPFFGIARGKNVILISAESLQTFPIGLKLNGQEITPRLTELISESLYFPNFHDQTYLGTTSDGEFTSLQSLHPLPDVIVASSYHKNHYYGLSAILATHGYHTWSAVAAESNFWNMNKMHPNLGFQQSFFSDYYDNSAYIGSWLTDEEFFSQTMPLLESQTEPFMAFLLSSSNHHPYILPEQYRVLDLGGMEGTLIGNYLSTVHYFDQALGQFVDQLEGAGLLDESILVIYGDHQGFLHEGMPELSQLLGLSERDRYEHFLITKRVPLIIRLPHGEGASVQEVYGGHLDISPTLLSLLGIDEQKNVMFGQDLTQGKNSLVVFRDGSFTEGTYYYINHFGPSSESVCYAVATKTTSDCSLLDAFSVEAKERLMFSDLIIRHDLIPELRTRLDEKFVSP